MEDVKREIKKQALYNALMFNGKASYGAVLGKVIAHDPSLKPRIKEIRPVINEIIKEVNSLNKEVQKLQLEEIDPDIFKERKETHEREHPLKKLENAEDSKLVMRFAPSGSGPLHIGHAYVCSLNSEYCRLYNGKLIVRIEDTNPEKAYLESYDMISEDAKWLTKDNISETIIQSERMEIYYKYAEELIEKGGMYVCVCKPEEFRKLINNKQACPCRDLSKEEHMKRWKRMFNDYEPGDAVARIKTDVSHKNPAMRDWPAIRINEAKHPRQENKFRVWPLMNFAVAIDDHELGITHAIRAKDHMDNEKRQKYLYDYFAWQTPTNLYVGRINFEDMPVSCGQTRKAIEEGKYSGWEDIRLPFLRALKRRGYKPEAFIKYALDIGITQNDKKVNKKEFFKTLNAFNKDTIDAKAYRYFFVNEPVRIKVSSAPKKEVELDLHPDYKKGGRRLITKGEFYITKHDLNNMKDNELYRLMDCYNIKKAGDSFIFDSEEYGKYKKEGKKIIHWLPAMPIDKLADIEVIMPDKSSISGYGEPALKEVKVNDVVQFERFGFVRCDKIDEKENKMVFWFGHR